MTEDRKQKSDRNLQFSAFTICFLISDLTPALLKKKMDKNNPYFVNYLRDTTLVYYHLPG